MSGAGDAGVSQEPPTGSKQASAQSSVRVMPP